MVAFVMGTTSSANAYDAFLHSKSKEISSLINALNTQSDFQAAYDFLNSDSNTKQMFTSLFGFDPSFLENAAPFVAIKSFPLQSLKEGQSEHFEALTFHWDPTYTTDVLWKKDSQNLSTSEDFVYVPGGDTQKTQALFSLYVGKDDGSSSIDFTKPYVLRTFKRDIENTLPATVPDVVLASSPLTANPVVSLQMDTGVSLENCDSFSQVAIVEGSLVAPAGSEFDAQNLHCTDDPYQIFHYTLQDQTDGPKYLRVWVRDSAGNISESSQYVTMNLESAAPTLTLTAPAANTSAQTGLTLTGTCDSSMDVDILGVGVSAPSSVSCVAGSFSAAITFSAGDGTKTVDLSQTDLGGNTVSVSRDFVRDNAAPILAFSTPAANTSAQSGLTITGDCESGLTINLSGAGLGSPSTTTCSSGHFSQLISFTGGDGTKTITLSQTDLAGNTGTASRNFVRDNVAPVLAFTAPAINASAQSGVIIEGSCEAGLTVNLSGAGLASPSTATCASGTFSQSVAFTGGDGTKTITVSQTDLAGNTGSASRNFVRDNVAPVLAFSTPAANTSAQTGVTITGTCEAGLTVNLSGTGLASPSTTTCPSGTFSQAITFTSGDGTKAITVSQTDEAGNTGSASRNFVKDTTAPVLAFSTPAANTEAKTGVTITGTCEAGLTVNLAGAGLASPSTTTCTSGSFSQAITFTSGDGTKTITVSQTDAAGNTGTASRDFIKDTAAPVLAFATPNANTSAQTGLTITGTCEAGLTVNLAGAGLASPSTTTCASGSFSQAITFTSGDGTKAITVSQTDAAGNTGSASRNFVRDTTAPTLAFSTPAANTSAQTGLTITGSCEAGLTVNLSGTGLASPSTTTCASGTFSQAITFTSVDGTKAITISQTDAAGNTGSASRNFIKDTTAPTLAFLTPAANTEAKTGVTITGTCENGLTVDLSGSGLASPSTTTCLGGSFSQAIVFTGTDGTKTITVSQTDAAGNTGSASRNFIKDMTAPVLTFTAPAAGASAKTGVTITGSCETGLTVNLSGAGLASPATTTCSSGSFSQSITFTTGDGPKDITISQTDPAGNTGSASRSFVRDNVAPVLAFALPAANTEAKTGVTITGTCEAGLTINLSGTGLASPSTTTCASGTFSQAITFTTGDGAKAITISQTDEAGNTGTASRSFVKDTVAPVLAFSLPAANTVAQTGVTITGSCEAGLTVNLSGTGLASPSTTTCASGSFSQVITFTSGDGTKAITVSQTDAAGNTGSASRNFVKDATGPAVTIATPAANTPAQSSVTLTGNCETGLTLSFSGSGILSAFDGTCSGGTYSQTVFFSSGDGTKTITVSQTDAVGNLGTVSRNFIRDNAAPTLTQTLKASPVYTNTNTVSFGGACETGLTITIKRDGSNESTTTCSASAWTYTTASQSSDNSRTYTFEQTDLAGNTGSISAVWIRDTVAPSLAITSSTSLLTSSDSVTFSGTCEAGTGNAITVKRDGTNEGSATCSSGSWSYTTATQTTDATRTYSFVYQDQAGNSTTKTATWERNTQVPNLLVTTASPVVTKTNSTTVSGNCEVGLNIEIKLGASVESTIPCSSGTFTYTLSTQTTDATRNYTFKQTNSVPLSTTQNFTWVRDTVAPTFVTSQMMIEGDATLTKKTFVHLDAKITDSGSKVMELCFKTDDTTTPTDTDSCWVEVSDPSIGLTPASTINLTNYGYNLPLVPQLYKVYGFAKDQAGNISQLTSSGAGTLNQDYDSITYTIPEPPSVDDLLVSKTDAPSKPLTAADVSISVAQPVFIKWSISDNRPLPSGTITLSFTTDDVNFTTIATGLSQGVNGGCTVDNGTTNADDDMTGCYKWASLPVSGYFRVRVTVVDDEDLTAGSTSYGLNVSGTITYLAGNTDPGIGYSAASAVYFTNDTYYAHTEAHLLAIARDGTMFFADYQKGLLKMDPLDGMLRVYVPITGTSTGDNASASSATLTTLEAIALDYTQPKQRLWIWDNNRIRKIDLATGVITTVIGGSGSDDSDTVNNPLQVKITRTADSFWQNAGVFFADKDGKFYFQGYNDLGTTSLTAGKTRVKVYDPTTNKVTSVKINSLPNTGSRPTGNYMDCRAYTLGFETTNKVPTRMIAGILSYTLWTTCNDETTFNFSFVDMASGNGESLSPKTPRNTNASWVEYGRFVQGLDGNLYMYGKYNPISGIWRYNKATADWTQLFGKFQMGYCPDGTDAFDCAAKIQDLFVSENGTLYFVDQGAIRTITADNKVLTLFGQPFISGINGPALSARIGTDVQVFHARTNGTIAFNELISYKFFEFTPGNNLFHIAGDGTTNNVTTGVDATLSGANMASDGDTWRKYFALDPTTGDIYQASGWYIDKMTRSSASVGASSQWSVWQGNGTKSYADPAADGTSDISFSVNCLLNDDPSQLYTPACQPPAVLGLGGGKIMGVAGQFNRRISDNAYVYRNDAHKFYDLTSKVQTNFVSTNTWDTNLYAACADGTSLDSCDFFPFRNGYASSPTYNPNTNTWYFSRQGLARVYKLTPGGTMQSFTTTQGIMAIAYRDAGSAEYLYYCSSASGQIRKYNLTTSTDTAMTWPVSSIKCQKSTMEWNDTLGGLVFIYKQDGSPLAGLALYHD
jgi:hypothetical protein